MVTDDVPPPDIRAMLDRNEIDLVVANQRRMEQR